MEDETSSSEPLLARVEAQCSTPNGNGFHAIDEHNNVEEEEAKSGFLKTLFNAVNILCGVGLLATPYAAAQMGWASLLLLVVLGLMFLYTAKLLGRCMADASWILTYPDIGEHAFGRRGRLLISIMLYSELYITAVDFLIMEGQNLSAIAPAFVPFGGALGSARQAWVIIAALIMLPTVYFRNMGLLAYLSAAGVLTSLSLTCLVGTIAAEHGFEHTELPFLKPRGLPLAIGLLSFNYGGHSVFPSLYTSMKNPRQYFRVLDWTFAIVIALYATMTVLGYLAYGETVQDNITLTAQERDPHAISTHIASWVTIVLPFAKYALLMMPIAAAIEEKVPATTTRSASYAKLLSSEAGKRSWRDKAQALTTSLAIRTALVASTVAVALSVPQFAYVTALGGALFGLTVCVCIPAVAFLKITRGKIGRVEQAFALCMAVIGAALSLIGTIQAVLKIVAGAV
ncbi:g69 [Coccomyxa viridis]|uniref:G69 protein n=1 Tax=Coccomyxa viridis TaxID=1274662 RepID=A0ABP1FGH1_9CHLO